MIRLKLYLNLSLFLNAAILLALYFDSQSQNPQIWPRSQTYGPLLDRWIGKSQVAEGLVAKVCGICEVNPELCNEFGAGNVARSIGFSGTNTRLKRFFRKAQKGEGFTVGVIGGSVSTGHGLHVPGEKYCNRNMHRIIFDHLDAIFPATNGTRIGGSVIEATDGKNVLVNGAQPATGSKYFSLCFAEHIPEVVDLVIIELAINDELLLRNRDSYDKLLRALLDLPNKPATIYLEVPSLLFKRIEVGGDLHESISQYYDVPIISIRNAILPDLLTNASKVQDWYLGEDQTEPDLRHINAHGHKMQADLANAYINTQLCEIQHSPPISYDDSQLDPLPRLSLHNQWDETTVTPPLRPSCSSANSEYHKLIPSQSEGWREWNWKDKNYLISDQPGSTISFKLNTALGVIHIGYLRSAAFHLGNIACWVDDDEDRTLVLEGYWIHDVNIAQGAEVRNDLEPGEHTLHCELLDTTADPGGGKEFRIISVMR